MKYKTNGNISPYGIPKVYFTGHPKDCKVYFENISNTILKLHNCAVFYDENPDKPDNDENFIIDLERMQLVVIIVTEKFLNSDNFAMNVVFNHAIDVGIPVLPVLEEPGIEKKFNDKCGHLHCLNPNVRDTTQLSFEEKLKKYLDTIFIKDETIEKIRQSFIGYIFLSYRKKDRKYAQELQQFHFRLIVATGRKPMVNIFSRNSSKGFFNKLIKNFRRTYFPLA